MCEYLEILKQIAANTAGDSSLKVALISAGSAVFGAGVVGFVNYLGVRANKDIERDRIKAELIATERLRWLRELRKLYSNYFGNIDFQISYLGRPISPQNAAEYQSSIDEFSKFVSEKSHMLMSVLNPKDPEQLALRKAIFQSQQFFDENLKSKQFEPIHIDMKKYLEIKDMSLGAMTAIGNETWRQVKELE